MLDATAQNALREAPPAARRAWPLRTAAAVALLGTLAFYIPLIAALQPGNIHWPGFMLSHDQRVFYFPSFVEGYRRFWHGGIAGLDFFTGDGASVFGFRPNLLPYYPPYLLSYLLFDCADIRTGLLAYLGINALHEAAGLFFTVVFARRYLGLPTGAAVLAAAVFGLTSYASIYVVFATFYFQMMLLPVAACALCWLARTRSRLAPILASPVFVTYALTNYGPTMLMGLGLAIAAALMSLYVLPEGRRWRALLRPAASLALAGLACAPYFVGQVAFKAVMAPTADDIDQVAHSLAFSGADLLNGLSQFVDLHRTHVEGTMAWGAIPVFLCLFGLDVLLQRGGAVAPRFARAAGVAGLVYLASLLPVLGTSLPSTADAFYYAAPIVGKMHLFQRYLVFSQFFLAILVAATASIGILHATPGMRRGCAHAGIAIWLAATAACLIWPPAQPTFMVGEFLTEMFLLAVAAVAIAAAPPLPAFVTAAALCAVVGLYSDYTLPLAFNKPAKLAVEPEPLGTEVAAMEQFLTDQGDGKALTKLVVASPSIATYFNRNLPWLIGGETRVMNFQGYPPHLSVLADYAALWSTYGRFDVPWLEEAGVDFVAWDDATGGPLSALTSRGYTIGPVLDLPFGNHIGKLHEPPALADGLLLDLARGASAPWPAAMALDGWSVQDRRLVRTPGGDNHIGYHVDEQPGRTYDVGLDVDPGSAGHLTIAFGNAVLDTLDVSGATHFEKRVTPSTVGDLWITAGTDFTGSLSDVRVRAAGRRAPASYDNGILRATGGEDPVQGFSTDYTSTVSADTESAEPFDLAYLLWPNPYMVPYLDGARAAWADPQARPLSLAVPAGRHRVEIRFDSRAARWFTRTMALYAALVLLALYAAVTAVLGLVPFYLPLLGALDETGARWPGFMLTSDIEHFYLPSFIEGYRRFWHGGLLGIDFLTDDGASVFAYRANLSPFYPPYLLAYLLVDVADPVKAAVAYCVVHILHTAAALYACVMLGRRFLRLRLSASVAFALLYSLSFQAAAYITFASFFFQMMLVPVVAYALCELMLARRILTVILISPVFLMFFLSSYAPMMLGAFATACAISAFVYVTRIRPRWSAAPWRRLVPPAASLAVAAATALPYYAAQARYGEEGALHYRSVQAIARDLSFSSRDLLSALSQAIRLGRTVTEGNLVWGLIPSAFVVLGLCTVAFRRDGLPRPLTMVFGASLAAYAACLTIVLGRSMATADMFYYAVPVLGTMHIYQRYLLFAQVFLAAAAASGLQIYAVWASPALRLAACLAVGLIWLGSSLALTSWAGLASAVDVDLFLAELFLTVLALAAAVVLRPGSAVLVGGALSALVSIHGMYELQSALGRAEVWTKLFNPRGREARDLETFLQPADKKALAKILYLTNGTYLYSNYPWMIGSDIKLMAYHGYEPHLAMLRDYWAMMGGYYGEFNRDWVRRTGLDFLAWDQATAGRVADLRALLGSGVHLGPVFSEGPNLSVARVVYDSVPTRAADDPVVSLPVGGPGDWHALSIADGWKVDNGRLVKVPGQNNSFSVALTARSGVRYDLSFRATGTKGLVFGGLGGSVDAVSISGDKTYNIRLAPTGRGDLYMRASDDFDGALSDIVLRDAPGDPVAPDMPTVFDDGLVRVEAPSDGTVVHGVRTNYATSIAADVTMGGAGRLTYLLWPNPYMVPYVDDTRADWVQSGNWPVYVEVPPGRHRVEIRFVSRWGLAFTIASVVYGAILLAALLLQTALLCRGGRRGRPLRPLGR